MGPYCKFCERRCFVPITFDWPEDIRKAYGHNTIAATCWAGQEYERQRLGVSFDDAEPFVTAASIIRAEQEVK